jgi:hypothetical protein
MRDPHEIAVFASASPTEGPNSRPDSAQLAGGGWEGGCDQPVSGGSFAVVPFLPLRRCRCLRLTASTGTVLTSSLSSSASSSSCELFGCRSDRGFLADRHSGERRRPRSVASRTSSDRARITVLSLTEPEGVTRETRSVTLPSGRSPSDVAVRASEAARCAVR